MIHFVERKNLYFILSGLLIVPGLIFLLLGGLKPGIEFKGGTLLDAHFVSAVGQPHGARIFQLDVFKIEREAGKIGFHGERFRARTKSCDVKLAVDQTVTIQPGKMQGGN